MHKQHITHFHSSFVSIFLFLFHVIVIFCFVYVLNFLAFNWNDENSTEKIKNAIGNSTKGELCA